MLISCGCLRSMKAVMRRKIFFGPGEKLFCDVSFEQGKKTCCIFGVLFHNHVVRPTYVQEHYTVCNAPFKSVNKSFFFSIC